MKMVSIVILNWNGRDYLRKFLPILIRHTYMPDVEILVADNGSVDGSVEFMEESYPDIRLIRLNENFGFSGGYNRAFAETESRYFLLLNSDIEVTPGWLQPLVDFMEKNRNAAACAPKVRDFLNRSHFEYAGAAGGYIDRFGYPFCRGRIFDRLEEDKGQHDRTAEVFWVSGACIMVRSELFREAGGLDELFFAHMEEIDLCWRLKRMGYGIYCIPSSTVYHVGGGTLERGHPRKTFLNFRNNLLLLYKNLPPEIRGRTIFVRMLFDYISAARFLMGGSFLDFRAVLRAHRTYFSLKRRYKGNLRNVNEQKKHDTVTGIYPGSIVIEFFLKGHRKIDQLDHYSMIKET